jgi:hypothetical protein
LRRSKLDAREIVTSLAVKTGFGANREIEAEQGPYAHCWRKGRMNFLSGTCGEPYFTHQPFSPRFPGCWERGERRQPGYAAAHLSPLARGSRSYATWFRVIAGLPHIGQGRTSRYLPLPSYPSFAMRFG